MAKESYSDLLNPKPIGRDRWRISLAGLLGISDSQWGGLHVFLLHSREIKSDGIICPRSFTNLPSQNNDRVIYW